MPEQRMLEMFVKHEIIWLTEDKFITSPISHNAIAYRSVPHKRNAWNL